MMHDAIITQLNTAAEALEREAKVLRGRVAELSHRGTGRTTSQALAVLTAAYAHPGLVISVHDHHGTDHAHYALRRKVLDMASTLGLQGFVACGMNSNHTADGHSHGIKYIKPTL